jgi:hypothetical protein
VSNFICLVLCVCLFVALWSLFFLIEAGKNWFQVTL